MPHPFTRDHDTLSSAPPDGMEQCELCTTSPVHYLCEHCSERVCRRCMLARHDDPNDCVWGAHKIVDLCPPANETASMNPVNPKTEARRLAALKNLGILDTPPDQRFDSLAKIASQFTQSNLVAISFLDATRVWFKSTIGFREAWAPRSNSLSSYVVDNACEGVFEVSDWREDPRFVDAPPVQGLRRTRFFAGVRIRCPITDEPVGVLCVLDLVPRTLTKFQNASLETLAEHIGVLLKLDLVQAQLKARKERHAQELVKVKRDFVRATQLRNRSVDFLCAVAHDIRTSLSGMLGIVTLLRTAPNINFEQAEYLDCIESGGAHLQSILGDVLDISKIEHDRLILDNRPFLLTKMIDDVVSMSYNLMSSKLSLYVFLDPLIPNELVGDVTRIKQVLVNFVSNAMKFTPTGHVGIHAKLISSADESPMRVCFVVSDTGIGISEYDQKHLFDAFHQSQQASPSEASNGWGLGLAVSYYLAQRMGGSVGATSELKKGSQFYLNVVLPIPEVLINPVQGRLRQQMFREGMAGRSPESATFADAEFTPKHEASLRAYGGDDMLGGTTLMSPPSSVIYGSSCSSAAMSPPPARRGLRLSHNLTTAPGFSGAAGSARPPEGMAILCAQVSPGPPIATASCLPRIRSSPAVVCLERPSPSDDVIATDSEDRPEMNSCEPEIYTELRLSPLRRTAKLSITPKTAPPVIDSRPLVRPAVPSAAPSPPALVVPGAEPAYQPSPAAAAAPFGFKPSRMVGAGRFLNTAPDLYMPDKTWVTADALRLEAQELQKRFPELERPDELSTELPFIAQSACGHFPDAPPFATLPSSNPSHLQAPELHPAVLFLLNDIMQALSLASIIAQFPHRDYLTTSWMELKRLLKAYRSLTTLESLLAIQEEDQHHQEQLFRHHHQLPSPVTSATQNSPSPVPEPELVQQFLPQNAQDVRLTPEKLKRAAVSWTSQPIRVIVLDMDNLPKNSVHSDGTKTFTMEGASVLALTAVTSGLQSPRAKQAADAAIREIKKEHRKADWEAPGDLPPRPHDAPTQKVKLDCAVGVAKGLAQTWAEIMGTEVALPPLMLLTSAVERPRVVQDPQIRQLFHFVVRKPISVTQTRQIFELILSLEDQAAPHPSLSSDISVEETDSKESTDMQHSDEHPHTYLPAVHEGEPSVDPQLYEMRQQVRVLLADDHRLNRIMVCRILHRLGYTNVECVVNGAEAVEIVRKAHGIGQDCQLIIMDKHMPIMGGSEACAQTLNLYKQWNDHRADEHKLEPPVIIALSASSSEEDRIRCHEAGVMAYLTKPVDSDELAETMDRWTIRKWYPDMFPGKDSRKASTEHAPGQSVRHPGGKPAGLSS